MTKRFVMAVENMSQTDQQDFVDFLRENKTGWWHRITNFWLITNGNDALSVESIRTKVREYTGANTCLVIEIVDDVTWAGIRPRSQADMFDWLGKTWANG